MGLIHYIICSYTAQPFNTGANYMHNIILLASNPFPSMTFLGRGITFVLTHFPPNCTTSLLPSLLPLLTSSCRSSMQKVIPKANPFGSVLNSHPTTVPMVSTVMVTLWQAPPSSPTSLKSELSGVRERPTGVDISLSLSATSNEASLVARAFISSLPCWLSRPRGNILPLVCVSITT